MIEDFDGLKSAIVPSPGRTRRMNSPTEGISFDTLESLLIFVFRQLETPLLSLDKIVDFLSHSIHSVPVEGNGIVSAGAVPRRLVLSTLSNSERFVRAGPPHSQGFALRLINPLFQCDASVAASVEQLLTENGPMTLDEFRSSPNFPASNVQLFERVFSVHSTEFTPLADGRIWFVNSPLPVQAAFDTIEEAVVFAFTIFTDGATPEDLRRFLCLARCTEGAITRIAVAKVLSAKPDLFIQIQRGKYAIAGSPAAQIPPPLPPGTIASSTSPSRTLPVEMEDAEDPFNPESFFGGGFSFSSE
jgi:hypothetical protein